MTDDDMEVLSVRLPLTRAQIASLDRLKIALGAKEPGQYGEFLSTRTGYIWSLLVTSLEDEMRDHAAEKAA